MSSTGDYGLDQAVLNALPKDSTILSVTDASKSDWTKTQCISVSTPDRPEQKFFLKSAPDSIGKTMMLSEYTATTAIRDKMPTLVAKPYTWGKFESSDTYFILFDYRNIDKTLPDHEMFVARLVELHRSGTSENGMFGFPVPTCDGAVPFTHAWQKNWATFYASLLRDQLDRDTEANGHWAELDEIFSRVERHVIPRLLGVLQFGGRELRPSLIHGDMWEGNIGTDTDTGEVIFVDASCFYAHNELELGLWRWAPVMKQFTERYLQLLPPSEPREEWDDRNRLYSLKTKINMSIDHQDDEGRAMRKAVYDDMVYLCEKYAPC